MKVFKESIQQLVKGAFQAMATFPAASISGLLFTITMMIRIQLEGDQAERLRLLFSSLHWGFALGSIFGLMAVTYVRRGQADSKGLLIANGLTGIVSLSSFLILYFWGRAIPVANDPVKVLSLSEIANMRMTMLLGITFLAFVLFATRPKDNLHLSRTIFMVQKAFFISLIYGIVLLAGSSAVAGAIQGLLYPAMSFKVYQHLGSIIGFVSFLLFLGAFPDFSKNEPDEKRQEAEHQSKFIQLLFSFILIPIILALTAVLLLWTVRIIFQGVGNNFIRLSSIATSYAVIGIWLYIMVHEAENKFAQTYRRVFPFATLVILAFEAWALWQQLATYGMQTTEYSFLLVWLVAVVAMLLLVFQKQLAYVIVLLLIMATMLFSVLPIVGYQRLPIQLQTQRLEQLLLQADMFENNKIVPGSDALAQPLREKMTVSAQFLARQDKTDLPSWFTIEPYDAESFKQVMGFTPIYPTQSDEQPYQMAVTSLRRKNQALDIQPFDWRVSLTYEDQKEGQAGEWVGAKGTYGIQWIMGNGNEAPTLRITLNQEVILEESLTSFLEALRTEYPPTTTMIEATMVETLQYTFETEEMAGIVVFNAIEISIDEETQQPTYWLELDAVYVKEE